MPGRTVRRCAALAILTLLIAAWSPARDGWAIRVLDPGGAAPNAVRGPAGVAFAYVRQGSQRTVVTFARLEHGVVHREPVSTEPVFLGPAFPAFDAQGSPWIAYWSFSPPQLILRHRTAGGAWEVAQTIPHAHPHALELAPDGTLALLYQKDSRPFVYATVDPGSNTLTSTTIRGTKAAFTGSLAFGPSGTPAVALLGDRLMYAEEDGGTWPVTVLGGGAIVGGASLAFDSTGAPCIAFTYQHRGTDDLDLRFARREADGTWTHETVDGGGFAGEYPSLGFLPDGRAVIAYEKRGPLPDQATFLEVAVQASTGWDTEHVVAIDPSRGTADLLVLASGRVGVVYPTGGGVEWAVKAFG
jgi:hypothetical protein